MEKISKYQQITDWVKNRIDSGDLKGGDKLESENVLSATFGISRQTVRHAFALLEREGILERVRGSGTYVKAEQSGAYISSELSDTVTIISTYVDDYIFPRILKSMVRTLEKAGYSARIVFTNNHLETERHQLIRLLEENSMDPLIVEPVMSGLPNPNLKYYRELKERGIPILFFHSFYPELDIPHVSMDDEMTGRIATEHLIRSGHTKIAGIFKADDGQGHRRYKGYLEALLSAGIEIRESRVCWIDSQELKNFSDAVPQLFERIRSCSACVCYNDEVAHELTEFALNSGVRIPEELSITSIDNSALSRLNTVPLTSVTHPMEELGAKAAENMLQLIQNPVFQATFEFPAEIEERSSVCNLNRISRLQRDD